MFHKVLKKVLNQKRVLVSIFLCVFYRILIQGVSNYIKILEKCFDKSYNLIDIKNTIDCVKFICSNKIIAVICIVIGLILILIICNIYFSIKNRKIENEGIKFKNKDGTFGTANWATIDEAKKFLSIGKEDGLIFGKTDNNKTVSLSENTYLNKNVAIFGSSGSKKTRSFAIINILKLADIGRSIICTDPKSELYKKTCVYLKKKGYTVKILNLVNPEYSDCWNPIYDVESETDAQVFAETVIANTEIDVSKSGDQFWTRTEQNLLKALILHVATEVEDITKKNMGYLYSILASGDLKTVDMVFKNSKGATKASYNIYALATDIVKQSIVTGLATRLQIFQIDKIKAMTTKRDINLDLAGKEKCAYFCVSSDMDRTFDFLAGLFFSFLFIRLTRQADRNKNGRLNVETYFVLDEFPNIGKIPDFEKKLSTMRSRGINTSIIFQSIAQLKNRYSNDVWQEILGNCDSKLCMGCNDIMTASYVSQLLGVATVETNSIRKENGFDGLLSYGIVNNGISARNLSNSDEVIKFNNELLIIIIRGQKAFIANKYDYSEHELSKQMEEIVIEEYKEKLDINVFKKSEFLSNNKKEKSEVLPTFEEFLKRRREKL